jgi:hypothetical protein
MAPTPTLIRGRLLILCLLLTACNAAMAIEEPAYSVVHRYDGFEVRRYAPYLVAETLVSAAAEDAGNQGFRILAAYIFGQNQGARSIAMTAPVAQSPSTIAMTAPVVQTASPAAVAPAALAPAALAPAAFAIQFAMPAGWTLATLPRPNDARVTLREIPARTVAVIRYSGTWSQSRYSEQLAMLRQDLAREGLRTHGDPIWARYDAPWKPWFLRRNEIWLPLD